MQEPDTIFPFRDVLSGVIRGKTEAELLELCGKPHAAEGDLRIYRFDQNLPPGTLGSPELVVIQIWLVDGCVGHAWIHLKFEDGLDYQEVLW